MVKVLLSVMLRTIKQKENIFLEEGDACFRRIDSNIRYTLKSMMKRDHVPFVIIS